MVERLQAGDHCETITIRNNKTGAQETRPANALLIYAGAMPRTDWLAGIVERDELGYVISGQHLMQAKASAPRAGRANRDPFYLETSVPGIFVAGDVRHRSAKGVTSGVGEGAMAVKLIHEYLGTLYNHETAADIQQSVKCRCSPVCADDATRLHQPGRGHRNARRAVLARRGRQPPPIFALILEGEVASWRSYDRQDVLMAVGKPGHFMGEIAILLQFPWLATARVAKPARFFRLDQDGFWKMLVPARPSPARFFAPWPSGFAIWKALRINGKNCSPSAPWRRDWRTN